MQIRALYDQTGRILAAVHLDAARVSRHPHPHPRPRERQAVGDFMVPAEHSHLSFVEACARLKVKTKGKVPALYSK
jgi:hypothetical protein